MYAATLCIGANSYASDGACCLNGGVCYDTMSELLCGIWGGVWHADATCASVECETNCGGTCSPGESIDCYGNCFPIDWIGDGYCDNGQYQWDTNSIYLNCEEFGYDGGDCSSEDPPLNAGACCIGALDDCKGRVCENQLYTTCINVGGQFLGENTSCAHDFCDCPPGMTRDCNGVCFPIYYLNDDICHDGHWYPENGEDAFEYVLDFSCLELACDGGDCTGVCSGSCCIGHDCIESVSYVTCGDNGGTFLGSGETCVGVDCSSVLIPQTIGSELSGTASPVSGQLSSGLAAKNGFYVVGLGNATLNSDGSEVAACNVYRGNSTLSETLYFESPVSGEVIVATDGVRVLLASSTTIVVFVDTGSSFAHEQTITIGSSLRNATISGNHIFLTTFDSWSGNGVHWFKRVGGIWNEQDLQFVDSNVQKTVVDGNHLALLGLSRLDMYEFSDNAWISRESFSLNGENQDVDLDDDMVLLGETTDYYPGTPSLAEATLIERVSGVWMVTEHLMPVNVRPDDDFASSVAIENGIACISIPQDDSSLIDSGAVAVYREVNGVWTYTNKLLPGNAIPRMRFGSHIAISGSSVLSYWKDLSDIWSFDDYGVQFVTMPDFEWLNSSGGGVDVVSNWVPSLPAASDSVSISIPAKFSITTSGTLPFANLHVGPSKPTIDLADSNVALSGSLNIAGSSNYTADLEVAHGQLTVFENSEIGATQKPGALSVSSSSTISFLNNVVLSRNSQLQVELNTTGSASLEFQGDASLYGSLLVSHSNPEFSPEVGESWVIFESPQSIPVSARFKVIVLPGIGRDKYFELEYSDLLPGTQLMATVQPISDLYDLADTDTFPVSGRATDITVADLGSVAGPADGYDDIAVSISGTPGSALILINDGKGAIGSQVTYTVGNYPTAIDGGDIDGDGTIDLAVTNADDDTLTVFQNNGGNPSSMSAMSPVSTGDYPIDIKMINIDDDGDKDIVVSCYGEEDVLPDNSVPGELQFFAVSPSARIQIIYVSSLLLEKPGKINPGDVNNDKDFDLNVSLGTAGKLALARRSMGRGFDWEVVQEISVGAMPSRIQNGDLDGDGDIDAVVSNEGSDTISILQMGVSNLYESELTIEVGNAPSSIALLDYDGDGDLDLAAIADNSSGQRVIYVYRNDTSLNPGNDITFSLEQVLNDGTNPILLGSGEMDGDSADDLVTIFSSPGFRGTDSTVAIKSVPATGSCVGDFDNSGSVDILDLLFIIGSWGTPNADITGDGTTDVLDILELIAVWGPCP